MIAPIHDEFHTRGNGTELPDAKFVTYEVEMVKHILFEVVRIIHIMIIGIVAYLDVRAPDDVLQKDQVVVMRKWKRIIWIWTGHTFRLASST